MCPRCMTSKGKVNPIYPFLSQSILNPFTSLSQMKNSATIEGSWQKVKSKTATALRQGKGYGRRRGAMCWCPWCGAIYFSSSEKRQEKMQAKGCSKNGTKQAKNAIAKQKWKKKLTKKKKKIENKEKLRQGEWAGSWQVGTWRCARLALCILYLLQLNAE